MGGMVLSAQGGSLRATIATLPVAEPNADAVGTFPFLTPVLTGETTIYAVTRPE